MSEPISISGAHEHNLAGFDLDLKRGVWTAVVGVSGSGKTSLVFDLLVREGRRRFLQSWSPRARAALGKLGAAEVHGVSGLPVPLAVGAGRMTRTERSTVGTLTGVSDLLRLVWARDSSGGPHSRSAFSFNSTGACESCGGLGLAECIDLDRLVVHPERSIRAGALGPTLPNGYTVYSQVTVEVLDTVCQAHGFSVDTPWDQLDRAQQEVIFYGSTAIRVPFGKHSLESRLKWDGITARPREEGFYRGLVPVMSETLKRSRNANILRYARSLACPDCEGTRLGPIGRSAKIDGLSLPQLGALPLEALGERLAGLKSAVLDAVRSDLDKRLEQAVQLGLGHLSLDRRSTTLADGELQRIRLLSQLGLRLGGLLLAFDEPTLGLHPEAHPGLARAIRALLDQGNTVLTVEHHPGFVSQAAHLVELGPGAGVLGGRVTRDEPMPTEPLGLAGRSSRQRSGTGQIVLRGARLHGLNTDLQLRVQALNIVMGPSGAGKSSLIFGTLLPAMQGMKPELYADLRGAQGLDVASVDARPLGKTPRSTPATYTGLFDAVRKHFAGLPGSREAGFTASHFSHNHKAGRCPACEGLGVERVGLHLMRDIERPCPACLGGRYRPEVLDVRWRQHSIADVLRCSIAEAHGLFADIPRIEPMLTALLELGLAHLQLGRSTTTLSRGEAQRVKLATLLGRATRRPTVILLDEPDRGLHPSDLDRLLDGLQALVDGGHTVVAISHHPAMWAAADQLIELRSGRATVLDAPPKLPPLPRPPSTPRSPPTHIELRGVRTHNLQSIDLSIPHRALTVVCGVSGSGKSSLVFDTLAAEAQRRFAETLPFQVRRFLRRQPQPALDSADGLTPTLSLEQRPLATPAHSTVATVSGLGPVLRLLFARAGRLDGEPTSLLAEHFSPQREAGRCPDCLGRGHHHRCSAAKLITDPQSSILDGALHGTKPGRFFTDPEDRHIALLRAAIGDEALHSPWSDLPQSVRELALYGSETVHRVRWSFRRGKRTGEHHLEEPWTGFLALVEVEARRHATRKDAPDWLAPFERVSCESCDGTGLNSVSRRVEWSGYTLPELLALPLVQLAPVLEQSSGFAPLTRRATEIVNSLIHLSLSNLSSNTSTALLSAGQGQRLRLAEVLHHGLTGLTLALDEPATGLDPQATEALIVSLRQQVQAGNTVIVVSHLPAMIRAADHLIELGPAGGIAGGQVLEQGPPAHVLQGSGHTARALAAPRVRETAPRAPSFRLAGLELPESGMVALCGPSGSGKTRLLETLRDQAQSGSPSRFRSVLYPEPPSHSTVGFALGLMRPLQHHLHRAHPELPTRAFSHNSPAGRCPACKGSGREVVSMDILADIRLPCPVCNGDRYKPEVCAAEVEGQSIVDLLKTPISLLSTSVPSLAQIAEHASALGLGHLHPGTSLSQLSGGERHRLGLLAALQDHRSPRLVLLDDPTRGLHGEDIGRMIRFMRRCAEDGDLFVIATHRVKLRSAADLEIELN